MENVKRACYIDLGRKCSCQTCTFWNVELDIEGTAFVCVVVCVLLLLLFFISLFG